MDIFSVSWGLTNKLGSNDLTFSEHDVNHDDTFPPVDTPFVYVVDG